MILYCWYCTLKNKNLIFYALHKNGKRYW